MADNLNLGHGAPVVIASTYVSVEDAQKALEKLSAAYLLKDSHNADTLRQFLNGLALKACEVTIDNDEDGFILEGAEQQGFDFVDDDASLYVVSARSLIEYTKRQRGPASEAGAQDTVRLDFMQGKGLDLDAQGGWEEGPPFRVHLVSGNRNDRQWLKIGHGYTLRDAIDDARKGYGDGR